jgi:hypothetical protein
MKNETKFAIVVIAMALAGTAYMLKCNATDWQKEHYEKQIPEWEKEMKEHSEEYEYLLIKKQEYEAKIGWIDNRLNELNERNNLLRSEKAKGIAILNGTYCGYIVKAGWTKEQSYWITRAWEISGCDKDFVAQLNGENGMWSVDRVGVTGDIGFCQIAPQWHPKIVNDPNFYDPEWQLNKCLELYRGGTKFYAPKTLANLTFYE